MDQAQTWLAGRRLILASGSPRRRELMEESGYRFEVVKPSESAECGVCSGETPPELVARLAFQKAEDVGRRIEGQAVIVGCDTVAECAGQILGKPAGEDHARQMLTLLRGREHRVYSGLCVWNWPSVFRSRMPMAGGVTDADLNRLDFSSLRTPRALRELNGVRISRRDRRARRVPILIRWRHLRSCETAFGREWCLA